MTRLIRFLALAAALAAPSARAQGTDLADLIARARAHQEATARTLHQYSWIQSETFTLEKPSGEVVETSRRKLRVYPMKDGTYVELLEVDGRAPTKKELAQVEKQNARSEKDAAKKGSGDEPDDDANGALLELLSRTKSEIVGRVTENGRELVGIAFEPDPQAKGDGVEKKLLRHSRGTVWIDAETAQPVRGEAGAADKFRVKGVVGIKDFSLEAEQVRVHDEIWLPSRFHLEGDFSFLGAKRSVVTDVTFSDYSRATVETDATVESAAPGEPKEHSQESAAERESERESERAAEREAARAAKAAGAGVTRRTGLVARPVAGPPLPTELARDEERIEREHEKRREWLNSLHRAAPGTDWRALEAANGERLMQQRNLLRLQKTFVLDTWTERGSANQAGRMHCAALGLDGVTLYAGSAHGGTWRGATDGSSWTPIGDNLFGGTHHIAVGAAPQETVLAMQGGGRLRYTQDQGLTWLTPVGLAPDIDGGKNLFSDPSDRSRVYALFHRPSGMEVYRSDDGGLTWLSINALGTQGADMWIDRVAGGTLYVLAGADLWSTNNGGGRWTQESTLAPGPYDGAVLAGSEAGGPTLYAALHVPFGAWELRRSDNGGRTWLRLPDLDDFWEILEASIGDPMLVTKGGLEMFRSTNGGAAWTLVNPWWAYYGSPGNTLHADHMGVDVVQLSGQETWFIGTDGGLYRSDDRVQTVQNLSLQGLRVSQYYSTHTSILDASRVLAGAQDQGYQRSTAPGSPLMPFDQLISGDYGHLTSGDRTHEWVYSTYPGFILVHQGELAPALSQLDFPVGSSQQWLPGVLADPTNREAFYFFADHLWRYERAAGGTWSSFQESTQDFAPDGTVTALSISRLDPRRRVLATAAGGMWYSTDSGFNWTRSVDPGPVAHYFSGTALEHSPDSPLIAIVGGSGYSNPAAFRTRDGGVTWQPIGAGLPPTLIYDIAWQGPGSTEVFAATEAGPYRLDQATDTWEYVGGLVAPLTTYWSVESIPEIGVIRFGTYGRGIWDWQAAIIGEAGNCSDGFDNEDDGLVDCADPDCATSDTDGDTRLDCSGDCATADSGVWAAPGEIAQLRVTKPVIGSDTARLAWTDDQLLAAGSGGVTDVVSGDLNDLRLSGWPAWAPCLVDDVSGLVHDDTSTGIAKLFYLVRAQNSCGTGPWGAGDAGPAVPVPECP